jgi:hypothetical protein
LSSLVVAIPARAADSQAMDRASSTEAAPSAEQLRIARQKFQQALALQTGGSFAKALGLLKEVAEIKATPQVRFNMALCEENLGELVAALGDYELAALDAQNAHLDHVEAEATDRLEKLKLRIPKLRITRTEDAGQGTYTLDGVELGESALDRDTPVDPGTHVVRLESRGRAPIEQEVRVDSGEVATVKFTLPPRAVETPPAPAPANASPTHDTRRTLAFVSGGVAVAALATSGFFYLERQSAINELESGCPSHKNCPAGNKDVADRGRTATTIANVTLGIGAALATTAVVLFYTGGSRSSTETARKPEPRSTWASLTLSPTHASAPVGATLSGSF